MATHFTIEHNPKGWVEIFKSAGMKSVVDSAGQRIADNAGDGFEYVQATKNIYTVGGFVVADSYQAKYLEATEKTLTKAVSG